MEHWPDPSLIDRLLFESAWPGLMLVGGLGLVFAARAWSQRSKKLGLTAGALLLTGLAFIPLTASITTDREAIHQRSIDLLHTTLPDLDPDRLKALCDDNVKFFVARSENPLFSGPQQIEALAQHALRTYRVEQWSIARLDARKLAPGIGESFLRLRTTLAVNQGIGAGAAFGLPTEWLITWQQQPDTHAWRIVRIDLLKISGQDAKPGQLP